jgi:peptide chain release factor 1
VSVIDPASISSDAKYQKVADEHFRVEWFSGTGKGGQHRNKKQNSCRMIHIPTGIVESRQGRKREDNLRQAREAILRTLQDNQHNHRRKQSQSLKKTQMGSGMRGDKIRTYRFQDDQVLDHQTGKSAKVSKVMRGRFDLLWL